ncbi:hypothetical protein GDO86_000995 [Hymenochirus boettgeri]|uniref:PWWP domain-containing protein MUM1L1 n=1 Tax=Hymenochirus boettgeri TaxID=247094 RepID=A0A8T2KD42_9PIPI|nr:hypothetical protein GDO86_000995 [Hymenochirus boettgeri]KAG8454596.1 hypothetical protein GDO86_000995 [Hymenochirus boettgeri]KAG8454597.1 hypothetical protein GDO86_000995 [Hymenochirus boettgeri]KAG8454598.1 hypothetical protein GDO86_000995 [Hymenochirus boettgeri]
MNSHGYVLCKWKGHFWPAKVLSKSSQQPKNNKIDVEILCLEEQINVNCKDTKPLIKIEIEKIAAELAKCKNSETPVEELTYRKALRIALDVLNEMPNTASSVKKNKSQNKPAFKDAVSEGAEIANKKKKNINSVYTTSEKKKTENKRERLDSKSKNPENTISGNKEGISEMSVLNKTLSKNSQKRGYQNSSSTTNGIKKAPGKKIKRLDLKKKIDPEDAIRTTAEICPLNNVCIDRVVHGISKATNENVISECGHFSGISTVKIGIKKTSASKVKNQNVLDINCSGGLGLRTKNARKARNTNLPDKIESSKQNQQEEKPYLSKLQSAVGNTCSTSLHSQIESSEMGNESVEKINGSHNHPIPEMEEEKGLSSELSMEISSPETTLFNPIWSEVDPDVELPSFLNQTDPVSFKPGMFVWCKYQKYPYWPSVVKVVRRKEHRANVLFVDDSLADSNNKMKGISVSLRNLKHYDCTEKSQLLEKAREDYGNAVDWCNEMIADYRIRMGCGSFLGSFVEYCTADISYPVRQEMRYGKSQLFFPIVDIDEEDSQIETTPSKSHQDRKLLPDRERAARDRANERLVEFIVKTRQAENHLMDILAGKKKSHWLQEFQVSERRMTCIETYLEDEKQVEYVVFYLKAICEQMGSVAERLMNKDPTAFIMDVLLPEAVIFAISATERINYRKAEKKYLNGPSVSKREIHMFEQQILEHRKIPKRRPEDQMESI